MQTNKENLKFPTAQILVFAKAPVVSKVKTRLIPAIGPERAAGLYQKMLEQTVETAVSSHLCSVKLLCTPDCTHEHMQALHQRFDIPVESQQGKNLGERMCNAATNSLGNHNFVVLIGSDCLQMTSAHLEQVLMVLTKDSCDAVITPAHDGGYVLLGLRRIQSELFENIQWGSNQVMDQTRSALKQLNWKWREMEYLRDLDTLEDLQHLKQHEHQYYLNTGVREYLESLFKSN